MKKICNSILAFILVFCMILTLPGDVWAAGNQQNAMEEIGEELEVTEETAEKLVTDMFGEPLEEGTETQQGFSVPLSVSHQLLRLSTGLRLGTFHTFLYLADLGNGFQ